ncbi:MAG: autotransporter outer membrane beta-barrel domain-containing protein [Rhodospirillales bacterium]
MAEHLQANFEANAASLNALFGALTNVATARDYRDVLDRLSSEQVNAIGTARLAASESFVSRMNGCQDEASVPAGLAGEHDCAWSRIVGNWMSREGSAEGVGYNQSSQTFQLGGQKQVAGKLVLWWFDRL